ncbi:RagB/SusD family nutrient uptake outer membrane protein [Adhaeribacter radiodurans]|uniref:RagB/SusD family nutrient uptake outer membrane protein n=1 Tax=Adhaeribacter radiodurans TaxID=2745197 RepID=A0A7L7LCS3_9BACT|nr:RagB/SusD family nutrient uptake outer membrane protein [Adhaeribacter radiodurans]QMU30638.1 RagB/SusD family nutrient uptake outer membrane protein [Adhaeribacter radiodurans]
MKKILLLIGSLAFFSQACKDVLDEKVVSSVTPEYYATATGFEDAVKASYEPLRTWYGTQRGFTLTVFGTDTYTKGADGDYKFVNDYTPNLNAQVDYIRDLWNDFYRAINTTNTVIDRAPTIQLDETLKGIRVAEARFLRAQYYFVLVQTYGPLHLALKETTDVQITASRSPVKDVYDVIVSDLESAIAVLPAKQNDYGRATKPAAEHLLAKVLLTRASIPEAAKPDDNQRAADLAKGVISNYDFALLPRFASVFDQGNQQHSEVVWSVQYTQDLITNSTGNSGHLYFLMEYDAGHKGTMRDIANGRPFKRFKPTLYTLDLFDRTKDSRYDGSFKQVFYANNPATLAPGMKLGDTAIWVAPYDVPAEVKATKNYEIIDRTAVLAPGNYRYFPSLSKFLDPLRPSIQHEPGSRDFMVARLAETYLIAAEALYKVGNIEEAVQYINAVRRRAALPGKETAMEITADQLNIDFILDERARELLGEMDRWFDLVRTGTLIDRVKKYNPDGAPNIQPFHVLRPIPNDQIDRTEGGAASFPQNPGY